MDKIDLTMWTHEAAISRLGIEDDGQSAYELAQMLNEDGSRNLVYGMTMDEIEEFFSFWLFQDCD